MVGDTLSCKNAAQHSGVYQSFIGETSKITRRVLWEFVTCSGPPSHLKGTIELTPVLPTCLYIWYMVTEIFVSTVAHKPACVTFLLTDNFSFFFFFFNYLFP